MRRLVILRHAAAEDKGAGQRDFDRRLTPAGRKDAATMGRWLARQGLRPDHVVSSPAPRALETALEACAALGVPAADVVQDAGVYEASAPFLLRRVGAAPAKASCVLLVGHNPGLEQLAVHLTGDEDLMRNGLAKAGAVVAELPDDWRDLGARTASSWRVADPDRL